MKIYALVGKSGTGKSFRAANLCRDNNIEGLIDDGLYIYKQNTFGGRSAKKETTKVGAIKTALFTNSEHRDAVLKLIDETDPKSILILGTSEGMVKRIGERLALPEISETIYIEDITSEEERKAARKQRYGQGKHIVPVPSAQLKREFSGYFMNPIKMIRGWDFTRYGGAEKTVVRPTYSYLGNFIISDRVIKDIVEIIAMDMKGIKKVTRVISSKHQGELRMAVSAIFNDTHIVMDEAMLFQRSCAEKVEEMTAFSVEKVDIEVRGIE